MRMSFETSGSLARERRCEVSSLSRNVVTASQVGGSALARESTYASGFKSLQITRRPSVHCLPGAGPVPPDRAGLPARAPRPVPPLGTLGGDGAVADGRDREPVPG